MVARLLADEVAEGDAYALPCGPNPSLAADQGVESSRAPPSRPDASPRAAHERAAFARWPRIQTLTEFFEKIRGIDRARSVFGRCGR